MTYKIELESKTEWAMGAAYFIGDFKVHHGYVPERFYKWFLSDHFDAIGSLAAFALYSKDDNRDMWFQIVLISDESRSVRYSKKLKGFVETLSLQLEPLQVKVHTWSLEEGNKSLVVEKFHEKADGFE